MTTQPGDLGDQQGSIPRPLAGRELFEWIALRRAHEGGVARFEGSYLDTGRRVPCFLPDVFDELVEAGLLTLAEPDPDSPGLRRVEHTSQGRARFAVLNKRQRQRTPQQLGAGRASVTVVETPAPTPASRLLLGEAQETRQETHQEPSE